ILANFFLEDFDRELEKSGRKLIRYADDFVILAHTREEAGVSLEQVRHLLEEAQLELNSEKTQITDFEHGFRFLGALFLGEKIWVPWKNDRIRGRLLFLARPLPLAMRERFQYAPPRSEMEAALDKAQLFTMAPPRVRKEESMAYLYLTEQGSILRKA